MEEKGFLYNKRIFFAILAAILTFLVYVPAINNSFVNRDDARYVYENPQIKSLSIDFLKWSLTSVVVSSWHPLTMISLGIDYAVWGLNPAGYHLTNILFHTLNTFLVFIFSYTLLLKKLESKINLTVAFVSSLLFGIHPLHVESVAWISERKDVLCAFFYLLTLISYLLYTVRKKNKYSIYAVCVSLFLLSIFSKAMAVSVPLVMLILDLYLNTDLFPNNKKGTLRMVVEKIPFFAISIFFSMVNMWAQEKALKTIDQIPLIVRVITAIRTYTFYLIKMLFPFNLAPLYPYPETIYINSYDYIFYFISFLFLMILFVLSILKKQRSFIACWAYYTVTIIPVIGLVQVGPQYAADRYTYLPSIAPFILLGALAGKSLLTDRNRIIVPLYLMGSCFLIFNTVKQIEIWKDSLSLWNQEIKVFPKTTFIPYEVRAGILAEKGRYKEAIEDYTSAIRLKPNLSSLFIGRGNLYSTVGAYSEAIRDYNKIINQKNTESDPDHIVATVYYNRGLAYSNLDLYQNALGDYDVAIRLGANFPELYNGRGIIYYKIGQIEEAVKDFKQAIKLRPDYENAYRNLGLLYLNNGKSEQAQIYLKKADELGKSRP